MILSKNSVTLATAYLLKALTLRQVLLISLNTSSSMPTMTNNSKFSVTRSVRIFAAPLMLYDLDSFYNQKVKIITDGLINHVNMF